MNSSIVEPSPVASSKWPTRLFAVAVLLAALAPLITLSGRMGNLPMERYPIFFRLFFFNDYAGSLAMLLAFIAAIAISPIKAATSALAHQVAKHPFVTASLSFVVLAALSRIVYQGFPLAMDEFAPNLQAHIFASGHLAATYPVELLDHMVVPGFQGSFIHVNHTTGQVISGYWPGLALMMAPFARLGIDWCLNPLLAAVGLLLIGDLAKQATGHEDARGWAILAALASPQYTINAISYYAMPGLLTLNLLFIWLLLRPGWSAATLAGIVGSLALVMHNPVPHALVAIPCGIWLLANRERRLRLIPLFIGYVPLTALLCLGWPLLASSMGLRPLGVSSIEAGFFGSWMHRLTSLFVLPGLDLLTTRVYAAWKTLIWTAPGLVIIPFIVKPQTAIQRLLLAGFLLTSVFYFFIPFDQGHGWGYRYLHAAWGLVPIAAGMFAMSCKPANRTFVAAAIAAGLIATPVFLYRTHATIATSIAQQLPLSKTAQTLVFIADQPGYYSPDLVRNYPQDQEEVIRMLSSGEDADRALVEKIAPGAILLVSDNRGSSWAVPAQTQLKLQ